MRVPELTSPKTSKDRQKLVLRQMANEFEKVTDVTEIPQGGSKIVNFMGNEIVVVNLAGEFHAFSNKCTHVGGPLSRGKIERFVVTCPWHGSKFDVRTGAVLGPPATTPLKTFVVKVEGGSVFVKKPT